MLDLVRSVFEIKSGDMRCSMLVGLVSRLCDTHFRVGASQGYWIPCFHLFLAVESVRLKQVEATGLWIRFHRSTPALPFSIFR